MTSFIVQLSCERMSRYSYLIALCIVFIGYTDADDFHSKTNGKVKIHARAANIISLHTRVRTSLMFLAGHKYLATDARYPIQAALGPSFYRHFPIPRLKKLHSGVAEACGQGIEPCVKILSNAYFEFNKSRKGRTEYHPFKNELQLFQFRTTGSYFMCMFSLKRNRLLAYATKISRYSISYCIAAFWETREYKESGVSLKDTRVNMQTFICAQILACPDPCYGRGTMGNVRKATDKSNPCRNLLYQDCHWVTNKNYNFDGLIRNKFNISCYCPSGYTWSSRFSLCVDKDECLTRSMVCRQPNTICQNILGSAVCVCKKGTQKNLKTMQCEPIFLLPQMKHTNATRKRVRKRQQPAIIHQLEILLGVSSAMISVKLGILPMIMSLVCVQFSL